MTLLFALFTLQAASVTVNKVVAVDGRHYRVEARGGAVKVYSKAFFTKPSVEGRARMRRAVEAATGCRISDDYWQEARLEGVLDCETSVSD
jgi:hypothetical protein